MAWVHIALGAAAIVCGLEAVVLLRDYHTGLICFVVGFAIMAYGHPPKKV